MHSVPKQRRRLLFSVIIKLLILLGLILLIMVFFNSLFVEDKTKVNAISKTQLPLAQIELSEMQKGEIRKTRWNNKEVAVLFRQFPEKLERSNTEAKKASTHESVEPQKRSKKTDYFVYFNTGDSKSCPLFYAAGIFKDVCSSNKYDESGRALKNNQQAFVIEIPPHYFDGNSVIFGRWKQ